MSTKKAAPPKKVQCKGCPWRKSAKLADIPGYSAAKHHRLSETIADPEKTYEQIGCPLRFMACHESREGADKMCVGWAVHQMGAGNNIGLRIKAMRDETLQNLHVVGEQHTCFEDTICRPKKRNPADGDAHEPVH